MLDILCIEGRLSPAQSHKVISNNPALWLENFPKLKTDGHKYDRGHTVVLSGGAAQTGAARLAAGAALRAGSGLVTLYSPPGAVLVNAAHLTAVMIKSIKNLDVLKLALDDPRITSVIAGPALGVGERTCLYVEAILYNDKCVVLDADALTSFKSEPKRLFNAIKRCSAPVVITPHIGEYQALFGGDRPTSDDQRVDAALSAVKISGAFVVLKGAGTLVASPGYDADSVRISKCTSAPSWLATAGSGDVLAGIIGGLLAQKMPAFKAASCGVWLHADAANRCGPALVSEDLDAGLKEAITAMVVNSG